MKTTKQNSNGRDEMRQPRTKEGMIRYIAKMHCANKNESRSAIGEKGLPYYRTAKEYSRCPQWKAAISIEAKKIRKDVRENKGLAWINQLKK